MQRHYFSLLLGLGMIAFKPNLAIATLPSSTIIPRHTKQATSQSSQRNLFQKLNLTSKQQDKINKIRHQYQGQIIQLKRKLQTAQEQLAQMMSGTDSATIIRNKYQEIAQFRQKLGELHFESMLAIREVLTPEQRQTFAEIIKARQE